MYTGLFIATMLQYNYTMYLNTILQYNTMQNKLQFCINNSMVNIYNVWKLE